MTPLWVAQLFTSAKSFEDNRLIGSRRLNGWGLHVARVRAAHRHASARRRRFAHLVRAEDREAFARDGFVVRKNFVHADTFASLLAEVDRYKGKAKEKLEGATLMRKISLGSATTLASIPTARALLDSAEWRGLLAYVGAHRARPTVYLQSIFRHVQQQGGVDPQTLLHADTFHPTVKAWLYLTDVAEDAGPLVYVPGSHRLTPARLEWERTKASCARHADDGDTRQGSFRIDPSELTDLGLPAPRPLAVPANTLVVADTNGFHARGPSVGRSRRVEIWAIGPRSPFLPSATIDRWVSSISLTKLKGLGDWRHIEAIGAFDAPAEFPA